MSNTIAAFGGSRGTTAVLSLHSLPPNHPTILRWVASRLNHNPRSSATTETRGPKSGPFSFGAI
jgi:hypothetical protein